MTAPAPFTLVCGCPRSGTTLLAAYFENAMRVAIPLETHFVPLFQRWLPLWGDLREPERARALLAAIEAFTRIVIYRGMRGSDPARLAEASLLPALERTAVEGARTYGDLLCRVYRSYAELAGCPAWGDKSAPFEPEDLARYAQAVPELKVVHIIRDGRDVWLSWREHWFGPRSLAESAWIWRRHVEQRRRWGRAHPERYLEVRYEDLLQRPEAELRRVAAFVGAPYVASATLGEDRLSRAVGSERTHRKLGGGLDAANQEKWVSRMAPAELELFSHIAGRTLRACGYPGADAPRSWTRRVRLNLLWVLGMLRRYASSTYALRRLRAVGPLGLGLVQRLGIDVRAVAK